MHVAGFDILDTNPKECHGGMWGPTYLSTKSRMGRCLSRTRRHRRDGPDSSLSKEDGGPAQWSTSTGLQAVNSIMRHLLCRSYHSKMFFTE